MVLTLVVCKILFNKDIFDIKFPLGNHISNPKEPHFHRPGTLLFDSIVGYANVLGIVAKLVACLQLRKRAPSSTSAVEATTMHKIAHRVENAPFNFIGFDAFGCQTMKKWPHTRL
jgi:hypothetical protein